MGEEVVPVEERGRGAPVEERGRVMRRWRREREGSRARGSEEEACREREREVPVGIELGRVLARGAYISRLVIIGFLVADHLSKL